MARKYTWDFFLAHAGADRETAEFLYELLRSRAKIFLDSCCLLLGDDWDSELASAQRNSLITVVLVSRRTETAYYQREEIASAIIMARQDKDKHRVVPIYLDDQHTIINIPYGLRLKHGLTVSDQNTLEEVAEKLLELLTKLQRKPQKRPSIQKNRNPPTGILTEIGETGTTVEDLQKSLDDKEEAISPPDSWIPIEETPNIDFVLLTRKLTLRDFRCWLQGEKVV